LAFDDQESFSVHRRRFKALSPTDPPIYMALDDFLIDHSRLPPGIWRATISGVFP